MGAWLAAGILLVATTIQVSAKEESLLDKTLIAQYRATFTTCTPDKTCFKHYVDANINSFFRINGTVIDLSTGVEKRIGKTLANVNGDGVNIWRVGLNSYSFEYSKSNGVNMKMTYTVSGDSCSISIILDASKIGRTTTTVLDVSQCRVVPGRHKL